MNPILRTDSYKPSHWLQYPPNTEGAFSHMVARSGKEIVFFGAQYVLKHLEQRVTHADIDFAKIIFQKHYGHLGFFNETKWRELVDKHEGRMMVEIKAVPEGTVVPTGNILVSVESTHKDFIWLVSYLETYLLHVWYPSTVATNSRNIKKVIKAFLEETGDTAGLEFKLHDFGFRGASSVESAGIGGLAHLVNFMGTDTLASFIVGLEYYNTLVDGYSIPAAEHSTITSYGKEGETEAYANMLEKFPTGLVAIVADSYDIVNAFENIFGGILAEKIKTRDGLVILRPDSGNPIELVPQLLNILEKKFGVTINEKGYKVLPNYLRLIWGDGINITSITNILTTMKLNGWSADNIAFGMGGALLQDVTRDDYGFAFKCSSITVDGKEIDVYKDPVTDKNKSSLKGRLKLIKLNGEYKTVRESEYPELPNELQTVFKDGELVKEQVWAEIRQRAAI